MSNCYTNVQSWGKFLYIRESNGEKFKTDNFHPRIWVTSQNPDSTFKTIEGLPVEEFDAGDIKECNEFVRNHQDIENFSVYGTIQPHYQYISQNYTKIEPKIEDIIIAYIDIETTCENGFPDLKTANEAVVSIAIRFSNQEKMLVFGYGTFTKEMDSAIFVQCIDEKDLLLKFLTAWTENYPDIITGWYVKLFDIPYLVTRMTNIIGETKMKKLSPWNIIKSEITTINGQEKVSYNIFGIATLDYIDLYKKFTYTTQESYKLDHIAFVELGQKKLDYKEYGSLHLLYKLDYEKFIIYNVQDVDLIIALEDKMKLLELAIMMAYDAKINFEDVFMALRVWDVIIYNYLLERNIVIPSKELNDKEDIVGGYVKEPIPGMYDWVMTFDLQSLYPHLIMQFSISPDNVVEEERIGVSIDDLVNKKFDTSYIHEKGYAMAANGVLFRRDKKGFLASLMDHMFAQRKEFKKKMIEAEKEFESKKNSASKEELKILINNISKYNNLQMAKKICLNSAYGAFANNFFRHYRKDLAEAITTSGQMTIRWIERKLNEYMNKTLETSGIDYIIAIDTDSVFLNLGPLHTKMMSNKNLTIEKKVDIFNKFSETKLLPFIEKSYEELARYLNAYEQRMVMKRECIADRGIWTGKKRYILNVHDSEGIRYSEPKIKIKGIEAVRSSTPLICRTKIKEALKIIMKSDEATMIEFISSFKKEFFTFKPEDIASPSSANNLQNYSSPSTIYKKATPIHIRGSLLFNNILFKNKLTGKYNKINEGEKVKSVYLKTPNPIRENIITFTNILPEEFGLHLFIDYETQFEKTFLNPLTKILDVINWQQETKSTLDFFFQ